MDTKWKNRKKGISFMVFFAGVSLTLYSGISLLQNLPGDFSWKHPEQAIEDDYQQSSRFREYISGRLETFLAMATDSFGSNYYDYYGSYSFYSYPEILTEDTVTAVQEAIAYEGMSDEELEDYLEWKSYQEPGLYSDWYDDWREQNDSLTDEQLRELLKEQHRKLAQRQHENMEKDENLLYSIAYDGNVLYANWEQPPVDGSMTLPEGYNFLLQYADGKVRICKDGQELEVYGDGYYREDSQWYVPGYRNFQADEEMKKAVIYMAVAQEPILYSESSYVKGRYWQMDNTLYWMRYKILARREMLIRNISGLAAGLALLVIAFLCRKSKREADAGIARFTGKIWFEVKILLLGAGLFVVSCVWGSRFFYYGSSLLRSVSAFTWLSLFWIAYLAVNDLRRNEKVWRHGLSAKLYRVFTSKGLVQPLPVKIARRNAAAFFIAAIYGLLMAAGGINGYLQNRWNSRTAVWGIVILFFLGMAGFLVLEYLVCRKNMETARDMEVLSNRIRNIRNGDYKKQENKSGEAGDTVPGTGHDLEGIMDQLEDIRHGMANAVDEQMKSERMKVELIANVSHDIKTPLTSIISYVQFLKEEKGLPEHVQDYVKILDEKSQRLKHMVQDVFEMSKAASGELPMHMEKLDFGKLLCQTLADMEEQIAGSRVTFRTQLPDVPVMIMADGQRMYRVFQNLFQNAIQYSLEGSRVFVTLQIDGKLGIASVKNTSHQELVEDRDFTERFTRGDQSRTDGGSGLGLSIAKSFTEACGGQFSWETNADLFVVTVSFRILEEK